MATKKWTIDFKETAFKQLSKLDKPVQNRIMTFLDNKVSRLHNPRQLGHQLMGNLSRFWRFRVGDYRLICSIKDNELTILVVEVGHRREIYH
jgi:mRNA interferase RelE/StbE